MPQFQNTLSYVDIAYFVLLILAFVSIFLLRRQTIRRQTRQSRAALFKELYLMVFGASDFGDAFFMLEKGQFVFGATTGYTPQERMVNRLLRFMDGHLGGRTYLAADHPTIADLACYSYVAHVPEGGVSLEPYPAVRAWISRVEALPQFVPMPASPIPQS